MGPPAAADVDYQAVSIVLKDAQNRSLSGILNFTVWQELEEEEEYDQEGAAYYVVAVILVYGLSMVLLIGSLAKKKMGDKGQEMEENQLHRFLEQMPDLREQNARDNYRQLKQDIRALVNKDSTATTTSSVATPQDPNSPPPPQTSAAPTQGTQGAAVGSNYNTGESGGGVTYNKKAVSFHAGETLARDEKGALVVGRKDSVYDADKEYLLSLANAKAGLSDDGASSYLEHSANSTTGLLSKDNGKGEGENNAKKARYDRLNDWPIENPSDIWVSYEPPETEEQRRQVEERIPLGYSPGRPHKAYYNSVPNSPSPPVGRRDMAVSVSQPTSPQKPVSLRTYTVPLKPEQQQQQQYAPRERPRSYAPPPNNQLFLPMQEMQQGQQGGPQVLPQSFMEPRNSWSPGQSAEHYLPLSPASPQPARQTPSSNRRLSPASFPAFQPPSPNARRLAAGGRAMSGVSSPLNPRGHPTVHRAAPYTPEQRTTPYSQEHRTTPYSPESRTTPYSPELRRASYSPEQRTGRYSPESRRAPYSQELRRASHSPEQRTARFSPESRRSPYSQEQAPLYPQESRTTPYSTESKSVPYSPDQRTPYSDEPRTTPYSQESRTTPYSPETRRTSYPHEEPHHEMERRRSRSRSPRTGSRGRSTSPNIIAGCHVTSDIANAVRVMADPPVNNQTDSRQTDDRRTNGRQTDNEDQLPSSREGSIDGLMHVTCL